MNVYLTVLTYMYVHIKRTLPYFVQISVAILFSPTVNRALASVWYDGLGSKRSHSVNIFLF